MTEAQTKLARELTAEAEWCWTPGMKAVGRRGIPSAWFRVEETVKRLTGEWADAVPDLGDEATAGAILGSLCRVVPLREILVCRERRENEAGPGGGWWVEAHVAATFGEAVACAWLAVVRGRRTGPPNEEIDLILDEPTGGTR